MTERKLATVRVIAEVQPIEGADKICAYRVDGWWVVDQVGKYSVGDLAIYCEVDSWMPHHLAPFLSKSKEPREFEGVKGERLRTIRLKGQVSQGLLLAIDYVIDKCGCWSQLEEGTDVTDWLHILKYEKLISAQLAGLIRGNFPSEVPKTNQERIQNLTKQFTDLQQQQWAVTEKLDGASVTFYLDIQGEFHVCSRNLDLKRDENNLYWKMAIDLDVEKRMRESSFEGIALQGEIIGEGIQGNQYKRKPVLHLFDVYDVSLGGYLDLVGVHRVAAHLDIKTVPVLDRDFPLNNYTIEELLVMAEDVSQLNDSQREGLVFQCLNYPEKSFKVISNKWLITNE